MIERFARLPSSLQRRARRETLAGVPALLAPPDTDAPAPFCIWLHGRTVNKELDPGRYLRWIRAGIGAVALDLPGHGERYDESAHSPQNTLRVVEQMIGEIDPVIEDLRARFAASFDTERIALGGMSAGGMATLRRLADPHPFRCAAVESTAGDFSFMPYEGRYPPDLIARLDPVAHVPTWRPIPLLALHSEKDEWVPVGAIRSLAESLREHYAAAGADPDLVTVVTWPETGAPNEHAGFGRVANDAKNVQTEFLARHLLAT